MFCLLVCRWCLVLSPPILLCCKFHSHLVCLNYTLFREVIIYLAFQKIKINNYMLDFVDFGLWKRSFFLPADYSSRDCLCAVPFFAFLLLLV
jgi:hypothetical protein